MKIVEIVQKLFGVQTTQTPPPGKIVSKEQLQVVAGGTNPSGNGDETRDSPTDTEPSP